MTSDLPNKRRNSPLADFVRKSVDSSSDGKPVESRRGFFAKSSVAIAGGAVLAAEQAVAMVPHVGGSDCLRVGVIGCGDRGKSATAEILRSQIAGSGKSVKLVAMADAFGSQLQAAYRSIHSRFADQVDVGDQRFVGMDGWRRMLACDLDLVILATPPVFRPKQLESAVASRLHVLMESPVAVDEEGLRRVREAGLIAEEFGLSIAAGLQRRHDPRAQETIGQLHDGKIGNLLCADITASVDPKPLSTRSSKMSNHDFELRNWTHFDWAGGGHFGSRLLNSVDAMNWAFDRIPIEVSGSLSNGIGGERKGDRPHSLNDDSNLIAFRYPDHRTVLVRKNEINASRTTRESIIGVDGSCDIGQGIIRDCSAKIIWRSQLRPSKGEAWQSQANQLVDAILTGKRFNETERAIAATSTWLMGRHHFALG